MLEDRDFRDAWSGGRRGVVTGLLADISIAARNARIIDGTRVWV